MLCSSASRRVERPLSVRVSLNRILGRCGEQVHVSAQPCGLALVDCVFQLCSRCLCCGDRARGANPRLRGMAPVSKGMRREAAAAAGARLNSCLLWAVACSPGPRGRRRLRRRRLGLQAAAHDLQRSHPLAQAAEPVSNRRKPAGELLRSAPLADVLLGGRADRAGHRLQQLRVRVLRSEQAESDARALSGSAVSRLHEFLQRLRGQRAAVEVAGHARQRLQRFADSLLRQPVRSEISSGRETVARAAPNALDVRRQEHRELLHLVAGVHHAAAGHLHALGGGADVAQRRQHRLDH